MPICIVQNYLKGKSTKTFYSALGFKVRHLPSIAGIYWSIHIFTSDLWFKHDVQTEVQPNAESTCSSAFNKSIWMHTLDLNKYKWKDKDVQTL